MNERSIFLLQKVFSGQGVKLLPDDPAELGLVLQRTCEVLAECLV